MPTAHSILLFMAVPCAERTALGSILGDQLAHSPDHRRRCLLRYIVADHRDHPAQIAAGEEARMRCRFLERMDAVAGAVQHDRRHRDWRLRGEALLDRFKRRIARSVAETMAV